MPTLLLTGASGFLGWQVARQAAPDWQVVGVAFSHPVAAAGFTLVSADLRRYRDVKRLMRDHRPDAVLHLAAASDLAYCQQHPRAAYQINVDAAVNIAGLCAARDIPLVFISSDQVFDGRQAPYRETDPVNPLNVYGEQKAAAEVLLRQLYPAVTICRLPLLFGPPGPVAGGFLAPLLAALRQSQPVRLFTDEFRNPLSTVAAARGLLAVLAHRPAIVHLGGPECLSRYDLGRRLAEFFHLPPDLVLPGSQHSASLATPRPANVCLDASRATALGFSPPPLAEQFLDLR